MTAFITDLLEKGKSPFSRNGSIPDAVQLDVHRTNDAQYHPCLPVVRSRGDYCLDDTTPNICAKRSTRHPSLLPGVFLVHCKHGTINVNFSSLWPPTCYCYPLFIPDYPDKLRVYALPVVLVIRFRFFLTNVRYFLERPKLFVTLSFQLSSQRIAQINWLACFVLFFAVYWLNRSFSYNLLAKWHNDLYK